jgi:hypothetical protein
LDRDLDVVVDDDVDEDVVDYADEDGELWICLAGDFDFDFVTTGTLVCDAESTVLESIDVGCNMSEPVQVRSV